MERKQCESCGIRPRAINYKKGSTTYYRRLCDSCLTEYKKSRTPQWQKQGYKKKLKCEACGFVSKYDEQLVVFEYKDDFKTICLNCETGAKISKKLEIRRGDLKPDF